MKLTFEQEKAIKVFEEWAGMNMVDIEDVTSGDKTFDEFWRWNLNHLRDIHFDIEREIEKAWELPIEFD